MAHGFTDTVHNELLDFVLRAEAPSLGATLYFALFDGGVEVSTGVWTNYARVAVTRNTTNFGAAASGDAANATLIDFGTASVSGGPETADELRVYDDPSAGTLLWQGPIAGGEKSINDGDPVTVPIGDADFGIAQTP